MNQSPFLAAFAQPDRRFSSGFGGVMFVCGLTHYMTDVDAATTDSPKGKKSGSLEHTDSYASVVREGFSTEDAASLLKDVKQQPKVTDVPLRRSSSRLNPSRVLLSPALLCFATFLAIWLQLGFHFHFSARSNSAVSKVRSLMARPDPSPF